MPAGPRAHEALRDLVQRFTERFGGATAYTRAPAKGVWRSAEGERETDDVMIVETLTDTLDDGYWLELKEELERRLDEEEVLVRATRAMTLKPVRTANECT